MANNKSAKKRILISKRNNLQNRFYKSSQVTADKEKAQIVLNSIYSLIDKGLKRNVYHKNTAARKKAKLAALLKASN